MSVYSSDSDCDSLLCDNVFLPILTYLQAYAANSTIPESQVQLLGPASRVATIDDISMWSVTEIDTLSALMDSSNGEWDPSLVSK